MKQTNIFDFLGKNIDVTADESNLTELENEIKRYIYLYHKGYQNGISAKDLSKRFNLGFENDGGRYLRKLMVNITAKSIIDFDSGNFGYFTCLKENKEIRNGNRIKRAIGSLETIIEGDPKAADIIYSEIYRIKAGL